MYEHGATAPKPGTIAWTIAEAERDRMAPLKREQGDQLHALHRVVWVDVLSRRYFVAVTSGLRREVLRRPACSSRRSHLPVSRLRGTRGNTRRPARGRAPRVAASSGRDGPSVDPPDEPGSSEAFSDAKDRLAGAHVTEPRPRELRLARCSSSTGPFAFGLDPELVSSARSRTAAARRRSRDDRPD
jgi:hypothetical protein